MKVVKIGSLKDLAVNLILWLILAGFCQWNAYALPSPETCPKTFTAAEAKESIALGRKFILANQKADGRFEYEFDWTTGRRSVDDNQVRQAGALWGLALLHQYNPGPETAKALEKGLAFFLTNSKLDSTGGRYIAYPGDGRGSIGTIALVALAYIDYLRSPGLSAANKASLNKQLDEYLVFLSSQINAQNILPDAYSVRDGKGAGLAPSPYSSGEALLALVKATKYLGKKYRDRIIPFALKSKKLFVETALVQNPDSDLTKGFYQWGSMAFYEIATSNWDLGKQFATPVLDLAVWMIDVHKTLARSKNTGYAYEGIVHAYALAKAEKNLALAEKFRCTIFSGLGKLMTWQVGSSKASDYIKAKQLGDAKGLGGVQNEEQNPILRIDVTQHQMHATILALKYLEDLQN